MTFVFLARSSTGTFKRRATQGIRLFRLEPTVSEAARARIRGISALRIREGSAKGMPQRRARGDEPVDCSDSLCDPGGRTRVSAA